MINPTGEKVKMEVRDLIPYVYLCDEEYRPTTGKEAKMVAKILGLMKDNVNRTIYIDGLSGGEVSESCDETSRSFGEEAERRGRRRGGDVSGRSSREASEEDDEERGYEQSEPAEDEAHMDDEDEDAREEEDHDDEDEGVRRAGDELDGDVGLLKLDPVK